VAELFSQGFKSELAAGYMVLNKLTTVAILVATSIFLACSAAFTNLTLT
jgi:hypothetical protein